MIAWLFLWVSLGFASSLEGTYLQDCLGGRQKSHTFQSNRISSVETNFSSLNCSDPQIKIEMEGTYQLAGIELDFIFEDVWLTVFRADVAQLYSDYKVCGISHWQAGVKQSIQGLSCDFFQSGFPFFVPKRGDQRFGIIAVNEDSIRMGRLTPFENASSPERRPTRWEDVSFQRQKIP